MSEENKELETPEEPAEEREEEQQEAAPPKAKRKQKGCTLTQEQAEQVEEALKQLDSMKDQFIRLSAEYDNYRKRTAKEKESIYQDAKMDTIAKFLEVYDNLERAVSQAGDEENAHKKGMEMIFHQLEAVLEKLGVAIMDPMGETFDPEVHNAVMHVEDESFGENIIVEEFQKGFKLGGKVIRFSMVKVAN